MGKVVKMETAVESDGKQDRWEILQDDFWDLLKLIDESIETSKKYDS